MGSNEKREKREVAFIVLGVLLVAIVGLILTKTIESDVGNGGALVGQAITIDTEGSATETGMHYVLESLCYNLENDGSSSCSEICGSNGDYCLPLEENCEDVATFNCRCCGI